MTFTADPSNQQVINQSANESNDQSTHQSTSASDDRQQEPIAEILEQTGLKLQSINQSVNQSVIPVLMLIGYNGSQYHGFQYQSVFQPLKQPNKQSKKRAHQQLSNNQSTDQPVNQSIDVSTNRRLVITNTIEYQLFLSLIKSNQLIDNLIDRSSLRWTRAARTDAGVHAVINYVSFNLYINQSTSQTTPQLLSLINQSINQSLPVDIRCHGLSLCQPTFHARFDCSMREYTYILPTWVIMSRDRLVDSIDIPNISSGDASINQSDKLSINQIVNQSIDLSNLDANSDPSAVIAAAEHIWRVMNQSINDQLQNQSINQSMTHSGHVSNDQPVNPTHRRTVKRSTLIKAQKLRQLIDQSNQQKLLDYIRAFRNQSTNHLNDQFEADRQAIKLKTQSLASATQSTDQSAFPSVSQSANQSISQPAYQSDNQSPVMDFRISEQELNEMNDVLKMFVGTHDFRRFGSALDAAVEQIRTVNHFCIDRLIEYDGVEYAVISIKGSSFMLHQIRRLISVSVALIRRWIGASTTEQLMGPGSPCTLALAPSTTLVLMKARFDAYDQSIKDYLVQSIDTIEKEFVDQHSAFARDLESSLLQDTTGLLAQYRSWLLSLLSSI